MKSRPRKEVGQGIVQYALLDLCFHQLAITNMLDNIMLIPCFKFEFDYVINCNHIYMIYRPDTIHDTIKIINHS